MRRGPDEPTWPPWWDQIWHRIGNWVIAIMCVIAFNFYPELLEPDTPEQAKPKKKEDGIWAHVM